MKRWIAIWLMMLMLLPSALASVPETLPAPIGDVVAEHRSDTLWWRIEETAHEDAQVFLTRVYMDDPGRQIGKATADWERNVLPTTEIAARAPEASLIINASGYVTKVYAWIPENYPGTSPDYYFTPLGSVTVTDGTVYRCLDGVPYYGLTLQADGLHLHVGEDPQAVLARQPVHTWSFYVECPVIRDHQSILDPDWRFTHSRAMRTIVAKLDDGSYLLMTVTSRGKKRGLTMQQCVDYLMAQFDPDWAYNLDGGPSSALMYRDEKGNLVSVWKTGQSNVDIMTFCD